MSDFTSQSTLNTPPPPSSNNRGRLAAIFGVLLLLMIGTNIYLLWSRSEQANTIVKQNDTIVQKDSLVTKLKVEYDAALKELDAQRGTNQELNAKIDKMKAELEQRRNDIARAISTGSTGKNQLEQKIKEMQEQAQSYLSDIKKLQEENGILKVKVDTLTSTTQKLSTAVDEGRKTIAQINEEKAKIDEQNKELAKKVDIASILKISDLKATPSITKKNGTDDWVSKAKTTEKIKIEFKVQENKVTKPGENYFLIRIINPRGEALSEESQGSGQFKDGDGKDMKFTAFKAFTYNNDSPNMTVYWKQSTPYEKGKYTVEVYNKGAKVGGGDFLLK